MPAIEFLTSPALGAIRGTRTNAGAFLAQDTRTTATEHRVTAGGVAGMLDSVGRCRAAALMIAGLVVSYGNVVPVGG
jgi:hypothetical protein